MAISHVYADNGDTSIDRKPGVSTVHVDNMPEAPSGGVTSVNGQTGDVTLTASDVGALPSSTVIPTVDQTYDATSTNAQSGVAVAEAIGTYNTLVQGAGITLTENSGSLTISANAQLPAYDDTYSGKVLQVQADGTLAWVTLT